MSERGRREEELQREADRRRAAGPPIDGERLAAEDLRVGTRRVASGEPRAERLSEDSTRRAARQGTREALEEKEQEESGGGGLYGSQIDASHILGAAIAEIVGTFILVFGGTAVAVGAILERPTAGAAYDSLTVALAFGVALVAIVAALGHVSGAHVNPAVTLGMAAARRFPWKYAPIYIAAQLGGGRARGPGHLADVRRSG